MNCYNHQDKQAVALCKNCLKALCKDCAKPEENGFSCSEKCHQEIVASNAMADKVKIMYGLQKGQAPIPTTLILFFGGGAAFLIWGLFGLIRGQSVGLFILSMGIIFIIVGIISYINLKNLKKR